MSSKITGLGHYASTGSSNTANNARAISKSAGTANTAFQSVPISRNINFEAEGETLQDYMTAASGESATAPISGSGLILGTARDINKFEDIQAASIPTNGIHDRLTDTAIDASGYTFTIDARWVDPDGNFVNPTGTVTVDLEILDGSGDYAQRDARQFQPMYHYNIGGTPVKKYLPLSTS